MRFPRYVTDVNGEADLIDAVDLVSKDEINVVDEFLTETAEKVYYLAITYTFMKSGQNWALANIKENRKVWEDTDPQIVSDEIQALHQKSRIDFYFYKE